jgi:hypothetical protein
LIVSTLGGINHSVSARSPQFRFPASYGSGSNILKARLVSRDPSAKTKTPVATNRFRRLARGHRPR